MDKLYKFLRKRTKKERCMLMAATDLIERNELKNFDIKKLSGFKKLFRVRLGEFRIIFKKGKSENYILRIDVRDDQTYRI